MSEAMSNLDIAVIISELNKTLIGGRIRNIYQINRTFIFKVKVREEDFYLLVEPGRRIHLTWYEREKPKIPPPFCMALRKHVRHGKILSIYQHDFDRIVVMDVGFAENKVSLVFELFGDGNIVLLDSDRKIVIAEKYASMKDREILPKKEYLFPPSRGRDPRNLTFEEFKEILAANKGKAAAVLVKNLNIGSILAEEACARGGVEKGKNVNDLSDEETQALFRALMETLSEAFEGKVKPGILFKEEKAFIASPIMLKMYSGGEFSWKEFDCFNKAADEFYSKMEELKVEEEKIEEKREKEDKVRRMIEAQKEALQRMMEAEEKYRRYGDLLYENIHIVSQLLDAILLARKKNYSWQEIEEKINSVKDKDPAAKMFVGIKPHEGRVLVKLNEEVIPLDVKLTAVENANAFYEKAKEAMAKAERIRKAMNDIMERAKAERETKEEKFKLRLKKKKKWYEKYRWTISSDGFLILGGKDAKSNISLYKKMEPNDIFFHADVHGAPVVIVKTEGKTCPETTLKEAAQFAVSYSRAWKEGVLQADAYWVYPEQVSETPPSGEYLPKGGLIIRGKRNYFHNVPLELAVGVISENDEIKVIAGPPSAVSKKTPNFVKIKPGNIAQGKLAEEIRRTIASKAPRELAEIILKIPLNDFQSVLPPGGGIIVG
ncbi:MAG: ribosome rescue protein RqcH [Candidatus Jordarchaeales archaeon]